MLNRTLRCYPHKSSRKRGKSSEMKKEILENDDFYARKLRKASFHTMKGCLLACDMYAFSMQKTVFYRSEIGLLTFSDFTRHFLAILTEPVDAFCLAVLIR
jgi:hypothetical protein